MNQASWIKPMFVRDTRGHGGIRDELLLLGETAIDDVLECGDIAFPGHGDQYIGVEIKETNDLLSSLRSGRLFEQTAKMLTDYTTAILLIYGYLGWGTSGVLRTDSGEKPSPPWPNLKSLNGALLSIASGGVIIPVIQRDPKGVALYLVQAYNWFQKAEHKGLLTRQQNFSLGHDQLAALHIVTGIPHISAALGRRLLEAFGTPMAIMAADEKQLMEVKGIGKKLAGIIFEASHTTWEG